MTINNSEGKKFGKEIPPLNLMNHNKRQYIQFILTIIKLLLNVLIQISSIKYHYIHLHIRVNHIENIIQEQHSP